MAKLVDKTYGQALFDLGIEDGKIDEYAKQVEVIRSMFHENPDLLKLLLHPQITKEEKVDVIETCFKGKVDDAVTGFMVIVVKAGRQGDFESIFSYFLNAVKAYKHIGTAYVTSAKALTDAQKKAVEERLLQLTDNVSYETYYKVDPSLIGGMVIRIGDKVVDSSIKTQPETISKKLMAIQLGNQ